MKTARKALMLILCAALLVSATVMGTLAYLTSTTEVVTNTFTVGNVAITLDEAKVTEYGVEVEDADRVTANAYKLIPGHNYVKDPTIHVAEDSEDCWLFVKVENGLTEIEADTTIADQMVANGWTAVAGAQNVYAYENTVEAETDVTVFDEFTLTDDAEVENYLDASITIVAYAVQADGFDTADAAWAAAPTNWQ